MKFLLISLLLCGMAYGVDSAPAKVDVTNVVPNKTVTVLPDVPKEVADQLKNLVIEGQAIQLSVNDLQSQYQRLSAQSNENLTARKTLMDETIKKSNLDPKVYTISITAKGVVSFVKIGGK